MKLPDVRLSVPADPSGNEYPFAWRPVWRGSLLALARENGWSAADVRGHVAALRRDGEAVLGGGAAGLWLLEQVRP